MSKPKYLKTSDFIKGPKKVRMKQAFKNRHYTVSTVEGVVLRPLQISDSGTGTFIMSYNCLGNDYLEMQVLCAKPAVRKRAVKLLNGDAVQVHGAFRILPGPEGKFLLFFVATLIRNHASWERYHQTEYLMDDVG